MNNIINQLLMKYQLERKKELLQKAEWISNLVSGEKAADGGVVDTGVADQTAVHRVPPSHKKRTQFDRSMFHPLIITNFPALCNRISKKT